MKLRFTFAAMLSLLAVTAAAEDKVVHIYNWSDYIAEDTVKKFEEATGIKVVYDVYDSNETLEAKLLAGNSGYDVVVPTSQFMRRQIQAGIYQPLKKDLIPNLKNLDPGLMKSAAAYDPDNEHSVIYMVLTTGLGYNIDKIKERLGADAPTDSWALIFDPKYAEKLKDCGIAMLDSPSDVLPSALAFLGLDPTSTNPDDLTKAADLIQSVRPFVRYFHSSQYISDLANGEVCAVLGYSGDIFIAKSRAEENKNGVNIAYSIPKEGALLSFDMMAVPADAPNPDAAMAWINFILEPQITADITNFVFYKNANAASWPLVDPAILNDPSIFPSAEVQAKLFPSVTYEPRVDRVITRLWTRVRTGQ